MSMIFPQRKILRLSGYDYSQEGAYFVTICVQNRLCLFGDIKDNEIHYNASGQMVAEWWEQLPTKFINLELDYFIVMPNHFHGILVIDKVSDRRETLSDFIRWFKTMTTNAYIRGVKTHDWSPFEGNLWQRSYYDNIIRHEEMLNRIREYILNNPSTWETDSQR